MIWLVHNSWNHHLNCTSKRTCTWWHLHLSDCNNASHALLLNRCVTCCIDCTKKIIFFKPHHSIVHVGYNHVAIPTALSCVKCMELWNVFLWDMFISINSVFMRSLLQLNCTLIGKTRIKTFRFSKSSKAWRVGILTQFPSTWSQGFELQSVMPWFIKVTTRILVTNVLKVPVLQLDSMALSSLQLLPLLPLPGSSLVVPFALWKSYIFLQSGTSPKLVLPWLSTAPSPPPFS